MKEAQGGVEKCGPKKRKSERLDTKGETVAENEEKNRFTWEESSMGCMKQKP